MLSGTTGTVRSKGLGSEGTKGYEVVVMVVRVLRGTKWYEVVVRVLMGTKGYEVVVMVLRILRGTKG